MIKKSPLVDGDAVVKAALGRLEQPARRLFMQRSLSLGGLSLLTGCVITDNEGVEKALLKISKMNDKVQAWLFDPNRLAPTYPASMITRPFPFNAFYGEDKVPQVDGDDFRLEVSGLVADRHAWSLPELHALPQSEQIPRHICVEGWSAIGRWGGVPFSTFLRRVGADLTAKYVGFKCADDYYTSIDMPTALHPQTLLTLTYDSQPLPPPLNFRSRPIIEM